MPNGLLSFDPYQLNFVSSDFQVRQANMILKFVLRALGFNFT